MDQYWFEMNILESNCKILLMNGSEQVEDYMEKCLDEKLGVCYVQDSPR